MDIIGIGTDIVAIQRIRSIWDRFGQAFAKRILTQDEYLELSTVKNPIAFLAKRYAAKEAFAKAFGTGFRPNGILLTEIGIRNDKLGRPHLIFSGHTAKILAERGVLASEVSLSDEKEYAIAFVILMGELAKKMPQ